MAVAETADRMRCMEVWGGNTYVHKGLCTPGLEVWVSSTPYEGSRHGGDVYYVSSCASGRITRLLLADVSGHGDEVVKVSEGLRDLMRRNVNLINQGRFVREMNEQFAAQSRHDEFATALVCTFFSPTRSLQFCNAGHPHPMLYSARTQSWQFAVDVAQIERAKGIADTPLGVIEDAGYSTYEIRLEPGDMVLCVSDAFTESRDAEGVMLGAEGLLDFVRGLRSSNPQDLIDALPAKLRQLRADNLDQDDATLLLFQADGSSPSISSDLLAPVRLFRSVRETSSESGSS